MMLACKQDVVGSQYSVVIRRFENEKTKLLQMCMGWKLDR